MTWMMRLHWIAAADTVAVGDEVAGNNIPPVDNIVRLNHIEVVLEMFLHEDYLCS